VPHLRHRAEGHPRGRRGGPRGAVVRRGRGAAAPVPADGVRRQLQMALHGVLPLSLDLLRGRGRLLLHPVLRARDAAVHPGHHRQGAAPSRRFDAAGRGGGLSRGGRLRVLHELPAQLPPVPHGQQGRRGAGRPGVPAPAVAALPLLRDAARGHHHRPGARAGNPPAVHGQRLAHGAPRHGLLRRLHRHHGPLQRGAHAAGPGLRGGHRPGVLRRHAAHQGEARREVPQGRHGAVLPGRVHHGHPDGEVHGPRGQDGPQLGEPPRGLHPVGLQPGQRGQRGRHRLAGPAEAHDARRDLLRRGPRLRQRAERGSAHRLPDVRLAAQRPRPAARAHVAGLPAGEALARTDRRHRQHALGSGGRLRVAQGPPGLDRPEGREVPLRPRRAAGPRRGEPRD